MVSHTQKEENEERRRNSQTEGMENGSFRYTLILSHLFVFVSNNFLRRWFIPNMNLSSMIGSSCVFSAFLTAFLAWRNKVFVTASTDTILPGFRLLFVFPPLLRSIFRHLYRPLFLCALRVHFFAQVTRCIHAIYRRSERKPATCTHLRRRSPPCTLWHRSTHCTR